MNFKICRLCLCNHLRQMLLGDAQQWDFRLLEVCGQYVPESYQKSRSYDEQICKEFSSESISTFVWTEEIWAKNKFPCPDQTVGEQVAFWYDPKHTVKVPCIPEWKVKNDYIPMHCRYFMEQLVSK
jgi:hypothetical protein